jgi:hypothetical protein
MMHGHLSGALRLVANQQFSCMIGATLAAERAQSMQALQYYSIMQQEHTSKCTSPKIVCLPVRIPPVDVVRVLVPVLF